MANAEKQFSNFKIHSQYSICEGAIKLDELASFCKEKKIKSIGICDSYNLCGALEFSEKVSKIGTQPIIGTQINFTIDEVIGKIPLFATTELGYKNLIKLSSLSYLNTDEKNEPRCHIKNLTDSNNELIILSGNYNDLFGKLFKANKIKKIVETVELLKSFFGDRFYFEIQRHGEAEESEFENFLIKLSLKLDIPLIASQEVYYLDSSMHEAHDALICIGTKSFIDDPNRVKLSNQHFFKSHEDLIELFKGLESHSYYSNSIICSVNLYYWYYFICVVHAINVFFFVITL